MGGIQGSLKFAADLQHTALVKAVITLSELLAEYKERGISFNVLALGAVQTEWKRLSGYQAPIKRTKWLYIFDFT
jgi:NAD(P)-dependent dehydrogenase (short-subunit alcohol dehydrogenase family)